MVNCVNWAKKADVYKYFAINHKIGITTVDVAYNNSSLIKLSIASEYHPNLLFTADSYRIGDSYEYKDYGDVGVSTSVPLAASHVVGNLTAEEIRYIRENAYTGYLTTQTGYFIEITTDEEKPLNVTLFIPESKLTPELKVKFAIGDTGNNTPVRVESTTSLPAAIPEAARTTHIDVQ